MKIISFAIAMLLTATISLAHDVALRVRFGMKDNEGRDWSGKLTPSKGDVKSIRGWRWLPGDTAKGNEFTIATRRQQPQSRADRQRIQAGGKMPIHDNGFIAALSGVDADTEISFDTEPAKLKLKLGDVPFGKSFISEDGNVSIERVPAAEELADTAADEDYPAAARGKDGRLYVAYLAFTHGKDFLGARERPTTPESGPNTGPLATGRVKKIEKPEDFDYLTQPTGGEQIYLCVRSADGKWGEPVAVTDGKLELYRPAIALDGDGGVWVFYSAHVDADKTLDHGNWELMARRFDADGKNPAEPVNVSNAKGNDFMPAAATDSNGKLHVTWVGARETWFHIFTATQADKGFGEATLLSAKDSNAWEPAIAADSNGNVAVAWDTYAKGDYDVYVTLSGSDGRFAEPKPVAATLAFEVRPSLAFDKDNKLWIAWEESGDQWGKDFGPLKKQGIPLYQTGRSVNCKVLDGDKWMSPPNVMDSVPAGSAPRRARQANAERQPTGAAGSIAPSFPRLTTDTSGNVWLAYRGKPGANWRVPVGSVWFEYVTKLSGDAWAEGVWVPRSSNILDNRPAIVGEEGRVTIVYSGDGRGEANPPKAGDPHLNGTVDGVGGADNSRPDAADDEAAPAVAAAPTAQPEQRPRRRGGGRRGVGTEINNDLFVASLDARSFEGDSKPASLSPSEPPTPAPTANYQTNEAAAIKAIRDFRIDINGEKLRIWRGEFHRHTEFSPDGGNDGGLLDMWRYGIDAADLDWIGDGDHDYGNGREYSWWTTQKAVTLFTIPKEFVPIYSYERSVSYPEGHRNVMFAQRGVRSLPRLPITSPDVEKPAPDTNMLYMYLKHFKGLCASHTSATDMGTDWRNNDPEVEPFVEIYQGDRNNYERPDSPRSAVTEAKLKQSTPEKESLGGWQPKGFVNLALKKGYRLAFQCSSDHISTHLSYCNVLIPADKEPTRESVLAAVRQRRVYGATDNIIADVRCKSADGKDHLMGEEFETSGAPTLNVHLIGPQKFVNVTIIKDDEVVHTIEPNSPDVTFTWTDPKPSEAGKTSYYYVRGQQAPDMDAITSGELVWASPMWIKMK